MQALLLLYTRTILFASTQSHYGIASCLGSAKFRRQLAIKAKLMISYIRNTKAISSVRGSIYMKPLRLLPRVTSVRLIIPVILAQQDVTV